MSRADKFLWSVRVSKTRVDAADICRSGKVRIAGSTVKPSKEIRVGDEIEVRKGDIFYRYKVLDIPLRRLPAKEVDSYLLDITPPEELSKLESKTLELSFGRREKGSGRPTKRERRILDSLFDPHNN
ncbi:MAG: RNA-binding S4 domain-containing protein [Bacteroidales bacterium]